MDRKPPAAYFDHAAAAPLLPEALEAMRPFFTDHFGNPQSIHRFGIEPARALEEARARVASLIGESSTARIVFTASATESNNLAVKGIARSLAAKGNHIVVSAVEHASVMSPARTLEREGFEVTEVRVDKYGTVHPGELEKSFHPGTVLAAVQHASNEIGTVQPLAELAAACRRHGVLLHSDGTAAVGRIPVDVGALGVDSYAFPAQSFYGPKGAAALWLRSGVRPRSLVEGGIQEKGRRAGTENVPAIVGMGRAAEIAALNLAAWSAHMARLGGRLLAALPERVEHIILTGHPEHRLPGHVSLCVEFVEGESMLLFLEDEGFAVASGSACTSKTLKASPVLLAIGLPHSVAQSSLMLTLGKDTTEAEVDRFLEKLPPIVERLRSMSPLYAKYQRGEDPYATPESSCEGGH